MEDLYRTFPQRIKPQLKIYFEELVRGNTPLVVNCAAGQDRTGVAAALLLSALGVPRDVVVEDHLLSTDFRRPANELGEVDLIAAAEHNAFARMMLTYHKGGKPAAPKPLVTGNNVPYITYTLAEIDKNYGSVESFLDKELGVDENDLKRLRDLYLQQ